jgi:glycosyltransferase involved in cell wall biosynthesis
MITYNHERFITKAIESVLAQRTSFPIELVIGDDASTDDTSRHIEVLEAQAPEVIRTLIRPTNIGMHRNLEGVLEECRGEFVAFLEGDDYWTSDEKLQLQADVLRVRDNAVGVIHPVTIVDSLGGETGTIYPEKVTTEIGTQELLKENIIPTASVMIRRDALVSLPDSYRKLKMRDWPMWVFASLHGPWLCFPKVMAAYRVHDGGAWSSLSGAERRDSVIELFHAFGAELPQPFSAIARQRLTQMHLAALEEALAHDRPADAHRELREVVRLLSYFRMREGKHLVTEFARQRLTQMHLAALKEALVCDRPADACRELHEVVRLLSYFRMRESKRLVSELWRTLSPRTHLAAKRTLRLIRQNPVNRIA